MHSTPKFSVIITNYNYGEYILDAIKSVLNQTNDDYQLIVVDDGSEDDSFDRIESIGDFRMTAIRKSNGGQASAFNAGFEKCEGEIICFLDSDDWWCTNKLEVLHSWDQILGREYSLLQHQMTISDGESEVPYKHVLPSGNCFAEMCKTENIDFFVPTSGIAIPRDICARIFPIPERLRICADAYLTRTAFVFGNVVSIPDSLAYYRKHSNLVFQNTSFDHTDYFVSTLFPALDEFYRTNNIRSTRFSAERYRRRTKAFSGVKAFARKVVGSFR